jgi:hypothetical protein
MGDLLKEREARALLQKEVAALKVKLETVCSRFMLLRTLKHVPSYRKAIFSNVTMHTCLVSTNSIGRKCSKFHESRNRYETLARPSFGNA